MVIRTWRPFASRVLNGRRKEAKFSEQTNSQLRWEIFYFQYSGIIVGNDKPFVKSKPCCSSNFIPGTLWLVCVTGSVCADTIVSRNAGSSEPIPLLALTPLYHSCKTELFGL